MKLKTTLDQWLVLKAVLEQGGFAQAAEFLHRSQSTVSYAVSQLQTQLGVKLLELNGRKAVLTPVGKVLFHRAMNLLESAQTLEKIAVDTQKDWPAEINIVVDDPFPRSVLTQALNKFHKLAKTRVQLYEVSLSGALDILEKENADIVVAFKPLKNYKEFSQAQIVKIAVANEDHVLHTFPQLTLDDLKNYLQLVVRDSGESRSEDKGWLEAAQRWTVASSQLALDLLQQNIGFAWLPLDLIENKKNLRILPLDVLQIKRFFLHLLFGKKTPPNQAALLFSKCLQEALLEYHKNLEVNLEKYLRS